MRIEGLKTRNSIGKEGPVLTVRHNVNTHRVGDIVIDIHGHPRLDRLDLNPQQAERLLIALDLVLSDGETA